MKEYFTFEKDSIGLHPPTEAKTSLPLLPCRLIFEHHCAENFLITEDHIGSDRRKLIGSLPDAGIRFDATWTADTANCLRLEIRLTGEPPAEWGALQQVESLHHKFPGWEFFPPVGWREFSASLDRPPEEGAGLQPPYGYPAFTKEAFLALEHPMAVCEAAGDQISLRHHPTWERGATLPLARLVVGVAKPGETATDVFSRYFSSMRRPAPERAIVEINTFWTDRYSPGLGYQTDLASYRRMAGEWARRILVGERGLVSHFLLDAGWQTHDSLYRPAPANGGPNDDALAALGREFNALGFELGLWFSLNGPIGIDMDWARAQGYRVSNEGCGAGYGSAGGRLTFICLTDRRWEEDLTGRLDELITRTPVMFFKSDWDNDAVADPQFTDKPERLREAIAETMMRIYGRMHAHREGLALRGAWWLSPWWFAHVDNTHLPNSGDLEVIDAPSLCQREASLTCRDAVYHHVMVHCRTPIPYDVICAHEFASAPRSPVQDSEESWMNCLAMWVSRGSQYLQLYLAPYGMQEWKAWSVRTMLQWFRAHEDVLWKGSTRMRGGNPGRSEVYAFHHVKEHREVLTLRNPAAFPQKIPSPSEWGMDKHGWTQVYPLVRKYEFPDEYLASHEVVILTKGLNSPPAETLINTEHGWRVPAVAASSEALHHTSEAIPALHTIPATAMTIERMAEDKWRLQGFLPYELESAEIVLLLHCPDPDGISFTAAVGRYPDEAASASVPVTICRPHGRRGFAQTRLDLPPSDPHQLVLRFSVGGGGEVFAFFTARARSEIRGAWVEGRWWNVSSGECSVPNELFPPASNRPRRVIAEIK